MVLILCPNCKTKIECTLIVDRLNIVVGNECKCNSCNQRYTVKVEFIQKGDE